MIFLCGAGTATVVATIVVGASVRTVVGIAFVAVVGIVVDVGMDGPFVIHENS